MASITWANVENFASELAAVPLAAQDDILAIVNTWFAVDLFSLGESDPQLKLCRILLAAHMASTVALPSGGASGAGGSTITAESGGDGLSVTYGSATLIQATNQLSETSYGRQLDAIRPTAARGPWVL